MTTFWNQLQAAMGDLFLDTFERTRGFLVTFTPRFMLALLILGCGWIGAVLLRKITVKLSRALGVDVVAERSGLRATLTRRGVASSLSHMLGWLVYWAVLLTALSLAFEQLGLVAAQRLIDEALHWAPRLVPAAALLSLGIFVSVPAGEFADRLAQIAQLPFHWLVGQAVRLGIIALAIFNVLEFLHLASGTVMMLAAVGVATVVLLGFGILAVFGRELASSMLARRFLLLDLTPGDWIESALVRGQLVEIGRTTTQLRENGEPIFVPNRLLAQAVIRKIQPPDTAASAGPA